MMREFFVLFLLMFIVNVWSTTLTPSPPPRVKYNSTSSSLDFGVLVSVRLLILSVVIVFTNIHLMTHVSQCLHFVSYNHPLNIVSYKKQIQKRRYPLVHALPCLFVFMLDLHEYQNILPCVLYFFDGSTFPLVRIQRLAAAAKVCSFDATLVVFLASSFSHTTHILCIFVVTLSYTHHFRKPTLWYLMLILTLSHDIETHPGPYAHNNYLTFMNWNLNSLAKDNFSRTQMIEAHNSLYNYDIISLCETSLNDDSTAQVPTIEGYTYEPGNHPNNVSHGGVGIYYKDSLPVVVRRDLSFDECIVLELKFPRRKIFFTVLYRSPSSNSKSVAFSEFIENLQNLHTNISAENPYAMFFTGDFNAHSKLWWTNGDTNPEGQDIADLFSALNLSQIISELHPKQ